MRLDFSTTFHPQNDCQSERTIQTLADMLWICMIDSGDQWDINLPLIEFAYNNSYHTSIEMTPYEVMYCHDPIWGVMTGAREREFL